MNKPATTYNPWFLIPFALWVVTGGVLLSIHGNEALFKAVNTRHTPFLDVGMYYTTMLGEGVFITIVLLVLLGVHSLRNWWYFTAALLCNVLPTLLTQVIKRRVGAPRPLKFFEGADWVHTLPGWPRLMENSFPSGHTCGAFAFFTFLALLLPVRYRAWGIVLFLIAFMVGYSRMYLAVHFFADVYAGSIIGTVVAVSVIAVMNRYQSAFFKK